MRAPTYSGHAGELFAPEAIDDPHRLYARLRRETPIARIAETGVHLVTNWQLVEEALSREEDFSANLTGVLIRDVDGQPTIFELPDTAATRVIATADDPEHAVHRSIVQPRLTAARVARLEDQVRDWAHGAIQSWISEGDGDFVPIAELIPARVVADLLGLPDEDVGRHRIWSMMGGDMLAGDVSHASLSQLAEETMKMMAYLGEHFETASAAPRTDSNAPMLHTLAHGVHTGDIEADEAVGIAAVMFGAGGESTAALIGSAVRRLAEEPDIADTLRRDPKLIENFVEEVVRLEPPFKFHYRVVRRECQLGSVELSPGDRLMLVWASANRDPAQFPDDPDELRLDRTHPRHHMSFGRGTHFCVGAALARMEARVVCEELLGATGRLGLCEAARPVYAPSIFVRRLECLQLAV